LFDFEIVNKTVFTLGTHVKSMSALNQSVQLAKINYLKLSLHLGYFLVNTLFYFYLVKKSHT